MSLLVSSSATGLGNEAHPFSGEWLASKGYCCVRLLICAMPITKEPPDRGKNGSTREIEMSNSTTARFLGGTPKAWMISSSDGSPHLPSGKTSLYQPRRAPQNPSNHQPPIPTEPGAVSDIQTELVDLTSEQQPHLPHVCNPDRRPNASEFDNTLPSPAPSDEHRQENFSFTDKDQVQLQQLRADAPSDGSNVISDESADLLEQLTQKYGGIEGIQKHLRSYVGREDSATEQPPQPPSMTAQASHSEAGGRRALDAEPDPPANKSARDGTRTHINNTPVSPHGPSRSSASSRISPMSSTISVTQNSSSDAVFNRFLGNLRVANSARRTPQSQEERITGSRFGLLEDALKQHDCFYLILHQIYCLSTHHTAKIRETCSGLELVHWQGLGLLRHLLIDNSALELVAVQWFQTFPLPIDLMLGNHAAFRTAYANVLIFLENFAHKWAQVKEESRVRCSPPSAYEMMTVFGIDSIVLQGVMYRAVHRLTWAGKDDRCYAEGEQAFFANQRVALRQRADPTQSQAMQEQFLNHQRELWVHHQLHCCVSIPPHAHAEPEAASIVPAQSTQRSNQGPQTRSFPHEGGPARRRGRPPLNITKWRVDKQVPITTRVRSPFVPPSSPAQFIPSTQTASPTLPSQMTQGENAQVSSPKPTRLQSIPSPQLSGFASSIHNLGTPATTQRFQPVASPRTWSIPINAGTQIPSRTFDRTRGPQSTFQRSTSRDEVEAFLALQEVQLRNGLQSTNASTLSTTNTGMPTPQPFNNASIAARASMGNLRAHAPPTPNIAAPQQASDMIFGRIDQYPQITTHSAVHQAHVRSPVTEVLDPANQLKTTTKHFTYIKDITILPDRLHIHKRHLTWTFDLSKEEVKSLVVYFQAQDGSRPRRIFRTGSMLYRFRSIKTSTTSHALTESEWVATDNVWPSGIAILLNGRGLEVRRKLHHGKDLSMDFTPGIKEGVNTVSIAISQAPQEDLTAYSFGLERLALTDAEIIKSEITTVSSDVARDRILRRSGLADPDVEVLDPTITLDLTDPFSSSLCHLPVRGTLCRHNQCFDLDIFLSTRSSKVPTEPCGPDQFRCPICGADARPKSLQIDGFFMTLRVELELVQRLDVKLVVLDEHGNWKIKEVEETGERGDGTGKRVLVESHALNTSGRENEVIELDDD